MLESGMGLAEHGNERAPRLAVEAMTSCRFWSRRRINHLAQPHIIIGGSLTVALLYVEFASSARLQWPSKAALKKVAVYDLGAAHLTILIPDPSKEQES
jgi:hypothetical protein